MILKPILVSVNFPTLAVLATLTGFATCATSSSAPAASHPRALAAAARVRPTLERDLQARGLQFGDPVFIRAFKEERVLELFEKTQIPPDASVRNGRYQFAP